jgi:hypothetical protein
MIYSSKKPEKGQVGIVIVSFVWDVRNFLNLHQFTNRLKQIFLWGLHGKYHLLSIVSFLFTVLYLTKFLRFYPNVVALLMTLTGLLIILTQQVVDATKFGSHKPNTFMGWLKSFPTGKPITLSAECAATSVSSGKVLFKLSISDDATIEKKVDFLIRQVTALDSAIARVDDRVDEVNSSLKKTAREFQTSVSTLTTTLNNVIASHVVGSYDVSLFGLNITICGTVIQFFHS